MYNELNNFCIVSDGVGGFIQQDVDHTKLFEFLNKAVFSNSICNPSKLKYTLGQKAR